MNSGAVRWPIPFLLSFLSLACALTALADTIHLKSARVIKGHVERFGNGEFVIRLAPTDDGTQPAERMILLVDSVESIEFDARSSPPSSAPTEKLIVLDANQDVVATGVQVSRGQRVRITATGQMQFPDGRASAPGGLDAGEAGPFPGERYGVLIAMVGSPQSAIYHIIGEEGEFEARQDGEIFLQVNAPSLQGARGGYTARIQVAAGSSSSPAPAPQEPLPGGSRELQQERTVPAASDWVDTGIDLLVGDILRIRAEGTILYTSSKTCGPNGGERTWGDLIRALPVNDVGRGALIGLIGQTGVATPFFIGEQAEFTVEKTGRLFLGINDDNYGNNSGSFRVQIEIVPGRR